MAESTTTRMGVPRWTEDTDTPHRTEFDSGFANLEARAAGFLSGTAAARPAAAAAYDRFVHWSYDTGVLEMCVDTSATGAGTYEWRAVTRGLPNGTAAAPAVAFGADPDTGLRLTSPGNLGVVTNGVDRVTFGDAALGPWADATYDLGVANFRWREVHATNLRAFHGGKAASALPSTYPIGYSQSTGNNDSAATNGWPGQYVQVMTWRTPSGETNQLVIDVLNGTAWVRASNGQADTWRLFYPLNHYHGVLAYATSAVSLPHNTWTEIGFGAEAFDQPGGTWSGPGPQPSLVINDTPPGKYLLQAGVLISSNATGTRSIQFLLNGNNLIGSQQLQAAPNQDTLIQATFIQTLAKNDVVKLRAYQNSGSTLSAAANYSYASLTWLGA